ncbi:MAG: MbcA/ParS/Xre antitoxin family protein [Nitrospiraceae bacterium]
MSTHTKIQTETNDETLVSKALLNAARRLEMTNIELAQIVGISESKLSRMDRQEAFVSRSGKEFDLALLFIRLYRSLDAITGGDRVTSAAWIRNPNKAFNNVPIVRMKSLEGLVDVVHYLDSRRAII